MIYECKIKEYEHINNIYKAVKLCLNCKNIYFNIDSKRNKNI